MDWVEARIQVEPELVEPLVQLFRRYTPNAGAVEEPGGFNPDEGERPDPLRPVTVIAYYPKDRRASWRQSRIEVGMRLLSLIRALPPLQWRVLKPAEWEQAWKAGFSALRLGRRLLIVPPWEVPSVASDSVLVQLDPGLAFGTGHHPTTRRCLLALEEHLRPDVRVLDLGCGSGILGIAALKLGAREVVALDTEAAAVRATRQNARANKVEGRLTVGRGTLPREGLGPVDLVLANISAQALIALAPHLRVALRPGGILIGSGVLVQRQEDVLGAMRSADLMPSQCYLDGEWVTFVCA